MDGETDPNVDLSTHGLVENLQTQSLTEIQQSFNSLSDKQTELADSISFENDKLRGAKESIRIEQMIQETSIYLNKLQSLNREMSNLSEKSNQLKVRALKLQEIKQKESLRREQLRQTEAEREELLVAKPE